MSSFADRRHAASTARRVARSPFVGLLGRVGLGAQGICFVVIGVLALALAAGVGGEPTDPQGALVALARGGWTKALLVVLAIGFPCYAVWRLAQALFDRGRMGSDLGGIAVGNAYWGLSGRFTESMHTEQMSPREVRGVTTLGRIGFLSLSVVFAIIGWFLVKAAVQFDPHDAVSIGGALAHLTRLDYGKALFALVAAGLFAYGLFGLVQARYHRT